MVENKARKEHKSNKREENANTPLDNDEKSIKETPVQTYSFQRLWQKFVLGTVTGSKDGTADGGDGDMERVKILLIVDTKRGCTVSLFRHLNHLFLYSV